MKLLFYINVRYNQRTTNWMILIISAILVLKPFYIVYPYSFQIIHFLDHCKIFYDSLLNIYWL